MLTSRWCQGPAAGSPGDRAAVSGGDSGAVGADGRAAANGDGSGVSGGRGGPLIVSVTDFTSDAYRDLPGIARRGFALRRRWPDLDGAVGMWLWGEPLARRSGSVSVWTGRRALAEFVRLPEHVAIMNEYRERGTIRSVTWEYEGFDEARMRRDAEAWLMSDDRCRDVRGAPRQRG
ncbi:hypothetical protein [Streptomyces zagrosensis]|uniref:DUF3291 domain-containing protein n=1 Tax=Streptomyces zagrosensis TaxID=1042984 RepID=A0A7W9UXC4_9ACTN|nr:hypothetical protein [Streptomyces zagrosensis]MBB5934141.1 hypothetical protein [Streptomyces zagrosensis]